MKRQRFHRKMVALAALSTSLSCTTTTLTAGCPAPSFDAAVDYDLETNLFLVGPSAVVAGDFNGDGKADLATANSGSGDVSILLGRGDGTFQSALNQHVGYELSSLAMGDFNSDGKADLAVTDKFTGNVYMLSGNGDGGFQTAIEATPISMPVCVVVSDFNGDGKADLAVAGPLIAIPESPDLNMVVLLSNGDGTFQLSAIYNAGGFPASIAAGDFNGDGKPDLVAADLSTSNVVVLLGNGDGSFQAGVNYAAARQYQFPCSVAVGDFNRDGKLDLAAAIYNIATNVSVLLGKGDGTFGVAVGYPVSSSSYAAGFGAYSVAIGDFSGNGSLDLAVVNYDSNDISVLSGNGDGTFQPGVSNAAGGGPDSAAVGDFNGDGAPDLAVANIGSGNVSVLLNSCAAFPPPLGVVRSNTDITISWPLSAVGFGLECATNLASTDWQSSLETPMTNNGRVEVTVPFDQEERFFRLYRP